MSSNWMKGMAAAAVGLLLLFGGGLPTWAEDPTSGETERSAFETEPTEDVTEPTEDATEPTEDVTEPTEDVTEPTEDVTEPTDAVRIRTFISLQIEGEELIISVRDETGEPVPEAPLTLYLDGEILTLTADGEGSVRHTLEERPVQISCVLPPFGGYESASSSLVLEPEGTTDGTEPEQTVTSAPTRPTATLGPVITWTNDPAGGEVTATEIVTDTVTDPAPAATEEPVPATVAAEAKENQYPRSTARTLIILGAVLLAAAALILYLFLAHGSRKEPEGSAEEKQETEEPEESGGEEE